VSELFLVAHVAGRGVAIPTEHVDSVVDIGEVVRVPGAEPCVRGLAALRSRVVTVIDTGLALGVGALAAASRAVITRVDGHLYAILVDTLEDVAPFARTPLPSGSRLQAGWRAAAAGVVERDGEPLLVLDPAALVPQPAAA
jgi:purine-binding chemotaxis protein CheW